MESRTGSREEERDVAAFEVYDFDRDADFHKVRTALDAR